MKKDGKVHSLMRSLGMKWSAPITVVLVLLTLGGFYLSKDLKLRLSLMDLLPEDHPSVVKFEQITEIVGGIGYLIAILEAEDGKSHLEVAPKLIEELNQKEGVRSAFYDREEFFFASRMLYYVSEKDLVRLENTIDDNIKKSKRKMFDLGLWDEEETKSEEIDPEIKKQAQEAAKVLPLLHGRNRKQMLLMIKPTFDSTDLGKTKTLIETTREVLERQLPDNVKYTFAGRYFNKVEDTNVIKKDIGVLGSLAIVLICTILVLYLRSFRALFVIFIPVIMGLGITTGLGVLFIGHINIVTGFLMGIVSGLGVDYGIHLVLRLRLEKQEPSSDDPDPIWRTLASSGHAVFIGAMAASLAFYFMCFSDFRAFSEFGFVCGTGIAAVLLCLLLSFSTLAKVFKLEQANYANSKGNWGTLPILGKRSELRLATALTVGLAIAGFFVHFEYDFEKMMQHSHQVQRANNLVDSIYGRSVTPSVFAVPEKDEAIAVEKDIEKNFMPKTIEAIISGATIIPENQPEKAVILARIKEKIKKFKNKWLSNELGISGATIRRWVNAKPFGFEDLPIHLQDMLRGTGASDYLMYLYPAVKFGTAEGVRTYAGFVREMEGRHPTVLTGSDAVLFAEILDLIKKDGTLILLVIFLSVGLFIWINTRRIDDTITSYLPLLLALPIGMGLMAAFQVKFNIFNIAIIPSFVAMGIDVPIHIVHRAREIRSGFKAARDLSASIHLALATAGVGFGVLIFSGAGVLRSLGWLAFLGTVAIWWTGLFLLPAILEAHYRRQDKKRPTDSDLGSGNGASNGNGSSGSDHHESLGESPIANSLNPPHP